jgi:hypothetical protein
MYVQFGFFYLILDRHKLIAWSGIREVSYPALTVIWQKFLKKDDFFIINMKAHRFLLSIKHGD